MSVLCDVLTAKVQLVQEVTFDLKSVVNGSFCMHVLVRGRIR